MANNSENNSKHTIKQKNSKPSVDEYRARLESFDFAQYQAALSKLMLSDIGKKTTKTYTKYTKENYRKYIENIISNESNLRGMSNFLYRASMPYRRFINYLSDIPLFYWNLIPQIDVTGNVSTDKILKNYYKVLQSLNNMSIPNEMRKVLNTTIREGVFYGFVYEDKNSFFIHKLDPDYCKIVELEGGCFNFAFDFSYFAKYPTYLEYWDPIFQTLHKQYEKDSTNFRWQLLPPERTICIKVDSDILDEIVPQLVGIFEALMDLIDARTMQRNKEEIQNYKLIVQKIPYFDNTREMDDFSLDIETALRFYRTLADVVPESVGIALSPMDIETVDFKTDDNSNDLISSSMKTVFGDSGISQLLFNSDKTGSVGVDASIKVDAAMVWKLVESIERWIKRYIGYNSSGTSKYFFEILRVDIFNKDNACTRELSLANSGVPNKLKLAATNGSNPYQTLSSAYFENEILDISNSWKPLQTSYTTSGNLEEEVKEPNDEADRNADNNGNQDGVDA